MQSEPPLQDQLISTPRSAIAFYPGPISRRQKDNLLTHSSGLLTSDNIHPEIKILPCTWEVCFLGHHSDDHSELLQHIHAYSSS